MPETTLAELLECVRTFAAAHFPGRRPKTIRLVLDEGEVVEMPVLPWAVAHERDRPAEKVKLAEIDKTILQAVAELGESPTGAEIARVAGYPYGPHLKTRLSLLRARKLLSGGKGDTGYTLTEAAVELLAAETGAPHA